MVNFASESKVWVYQADRVLNEKELEFIKVKSEKFISDWTAHGKLLKAQLQVIYDRFLVLIVDETQADASGCGIDKSIQFFQQIERALGINLMNRLLVAYKEGSLIKTCSLSSFETKIATGEVKPDTIVFNNLVTNLTEFETEWEVPLMQSWHNRLLVN